MKLSKDAQKILNNFKSGFKNEIGKNWDVDHFRNKLSIANLKKHKYLKKYKFKDFHVFFDARKLCSYNDCNDGYALILMIRDNIVYTNHGYSRTNHIAFQEKNIKKVCKISDIIPDLISHRIIKDYQLLALISIINIKI